MLRKAQMMAKRLYVLLSEVEDLSRQLAEALDRNDQVTARMLIAMRGEPIHKAEQARQALSALRDGMSAQDAERLTELLNGAEAGAEIEKPLAAQLRSNDLLLKRVLALDESLNLKIAREQSVYRK